MCVVSSEEKAEICRRMGAELIINRSEADYRFWKDERTQDPQEWRRFGSDIRELTGGEDVDIVFEHPGRETFGASVYAARKGGTIVTCASTSRLPPRVRQPLPLDEPQADHRLALRQLPRVVGGQPADRQGDDPPDPVAVLPAGRRSARPRSTCTTTSTRARSASSAWPPRRVSASATRRSAPATSTPSTRSAASELVRRPTSPRPARSGRRVATGGRRRASYGVEVVPAHRQDWAHIELSGGCRTP